MMTPVRRASPVVALVAIPLALGLVITLLATGLIAGWPLLPAAVAASR